MADEPPALPPVTAYLLDELEFRYAVPRCCRVCGAALELAATRDMKHACTSDAASMFRDRQAAARVTWQQALDHRIQSELHNPPDGDVRVLALIRAYRELMRAEAARVPGTG